MKSNCKQSEAATHLVADKRGKKLHCEWEKMHTLAQLCKRNRLSNEASEKLIILWLYILFEK